MPDADISVGRDFAIEIAPGRQVCQRSIGGISMKQFKVTPVLDYENVREAEYRARVQKSKLRLFGEFGQHPRHRGSDRYPLPELPPLVHPHPDQEDDKIAVKPSGHPLRNYLGHGKSSLAEINSTRQYGLVYGARLCRARVRRAPLPQ